MFVLWIRINDLSFIGGMLFFNKKISCGGSRCFLLKSRILLFRVVNNYYVFIYSKGRGLHEIIVHWFKNFWHINEYLLPPTDWLSFISFICKSFFLPKFKFSTHGSLLSGEKRHIIRVWINITFGTYDTLSDAHCIIFF